MMIYDNFMTCLMTCLTTMFVNRAPGIKCIKMLTYSLSDGSCLATMK